MEIRSFSLLVLGDALREGWSLFGRMRSSAIAYAMFFTLIGVVILSILLLTGFAPFILAMMGAFMLVGPAILAGFFGLAAVNEKGTMPVIGDAMRGFSRASPGIWIISVVSVLLFLIFVTDAAILYSYMVGAKSFGMEDFTSPSSGVRRFLLWASVSGLVVAFLIYCVAAFSIPLLSERRASLVTAVATSVKLVFGNFIPAMAWGIVLSALIMGSILLLPLLPVVLPWMAFSSWALYRKVLPLSQ